MTRPRRRLTQDCCELQIEPAPPRDRHRHSDRARLRELRRLRRDGSRRDILEDSLWLSTELEMRARRLAETDVADAEEAGSCTLTRRT